VSEGCEEGGGEVAASIAGYSQQYWWRSNMNSRWTKPSK